MATCFAWNTTLLDNNEFAISLSIADKENVTPSDTRARNRGLRKSWLSPHAELSLSHVSGAIWWLSTILGSWCHRTDSRDHSNEFFTRLERRGHPDWRFHCRSSIPIVSCSINTLMPSMVTDRICEELLLRCYQSQSEPYAQPEHQYILDSRRVAHRLPGELRNLEEFWNDSAHAGR